MRGRRPKPDVLKQLSGTSRRQRTTSAVVPTTPLTAPADLSAEAREVWDYTVAQMPANVLGGIDRDLLRAYVAAVVLHRQAERELAKHGAVAVGPRGGRATVTPWARILQAQTEAIRRLSEQLGIGPAARSRLGLQPATTDDDDEYLQFIRRRHEKDDES